MPDVTDQTNVHPESLDAAMEFGPLNDDMTLVVVKPTN